MGQDHRNKKINKWTVASLLFFLGAIICIGILVMTSIDKKRRAEEMSNLVSSTGTSKEESEPKQESSSLEEHSSEATDPSETEPEPLDPFEESVRLLTEAGIPIPDLAVDLPALRESVNADIYAWIYVPGTQVNYPVLQHPTNDSYYLNYNIDGSKGYPGCIYTEKKYNGKDFTDANTVLYGHNMKNGTMFGSIHKYEDEDFFNENRYIYVYTQEKLLVYKIFAAYVHSNEHLLYNNDFEDGASFLQYFEKVKKNRNMHCIIAEDVELTGENQHIITLSTCINNKPDNRYLVQGVLINEE